MQLSIQWKLLALVTGILVFTILLLSSTAILRETSALQQQIEQRAVQFADFSTKPIIDEFVTFRTPEEKHAHIDSIRQKNPDVVGMTILSKTGKILLSPSLYTPGETIEQEQILDIVANPDQYAGQPQVFYTVLADGDRYLQMVVPYIDAVNKVYYASVLYTVSLRSIEQARADVITQNILLAALVFIVSVLITILTSRQLTKPIGLLVTHGEQIAQGRLVQAIPFSHRKDEIGVLGSAFSRITDYFREITQIAKHVAEGGLEDEVHTRSQSDMLGQALQNMLVYLQAMSNIAANIARGDLTREILLRSEGDAFGRAMQAMTTGLQSLIRQIRASADHIAATGMTIASLSEQDVNIVQTVQTSVEKMVTTVNVMETHVENVADNMNILAASVEQTSISVTQMTSSISDIAANTSNLAQQTQKTISAIETTVQTLEEVTEKTSTSKQLAHDTIQDAFQGQEAFGQVRASIDSLQQLNQQTTETMTRFEQRSRDIGTILDVIQEVTEQSSLLSLNASIIAAQAGSHGRGFAVIAEEMRNLSNTVGDSTKDIVAIVHSIQQDTITLVEMIEKGTVKIEQGVKLTQQAQQVLQHILESAQRSSTMVTDIADALKMQRTTNRDIMEDMELVNAMTTEITNATGEQKTTTMQIHEAVELIFTMASQTRESATQQIDGIRQILEAATVVSQLNEKNLHSSEQINHTTADLAAQSASLLQSVDRFKLRA